MFQVICCSIFDVRGHLHPVIDKLFVKVCLLPLRLFSSEWSLFCGIESEADPPDICREKLTSVVFSNPLKYGVPFLTFGTYTVARFFFNVVVGLVPVPDVAYWFNFSLLALLLTRPQRNRQLKGHDSQQKWNPHQRHFQDLSSIDTRDKIKGTIL